MKNVLVLLGLVALVTVVAVKTHQELKLKKVDDHFIKLQKKILLLFEQSDQLDRDSEYYKIGKEYNIEAHINCYTNKQVVEEFLTLYRAGFLPKFHKFSIFYERMRNEAIALFHLMYFARDFNDFYNTAAWAKVHLNEEQFLYAFYIAVVQRPDTTSIGIVLPAPYEVYPQFFLNKEALFRIYVVRMQNGLFNNDFAAQYGIVNENGNYIFYTNYSNALTYPNMEQKLAYFTEDVGLNSYYYYFHSELPFWWQSEKFLSKERFGEFFFYYYQQLLARYSLERLSNGLGDIPEFSWYSKFETGYYPQMTGNFLPYAQRSNHYDIHTKKNYEYICFLDVFEKTFFQFLQKGDLKYAEKKINHLVNYWHMNADLYSEYNKKELHQYSYEIIARHVLSASPEPFDKYTFMPTALAFYQTSLRDPAFYQLYQRIIKYLIDYKQYVEPYNQDELHFVGVKINDIQVSELATYFDYFDFNVTNSVFFSQKELKAYPNGFIIRQPRLNHKSFTVNINVQSDKEAYAVFKIFIGPKYNANGYPVSIEENWMKFYELDWFIHKLVPGKNKVERKSNEFVFFKDDSVPIHEIYKLLDQGSVPYDMSEVPDNMPRRLMLPKGSTGGLPLQMFVFVYPYNGDIKEQTVHTNYLLDKAFGYPLDRPVREDFKQPNMYFEDIKIYHKGAYFPYQLNVFSYFTDKM